jgi:DNA-binding transcriptional LysR family regulator
MSERYPGVEIAAEVLPTPQVVRAVVDGRADHGVARTPTPSEGVRLRTVRLERRGVLVPAGHPLAADAEVELSAVAEYPILAHPRSANPAHHDLVVDLFRRDGLEPRLVERPVAFDPTQRLIREGRAIGLAGASSVEGMGAGLCWVPLAEPAARLEVQLVLRDGEPSSPVADRFERVAVAVAAAAGWLDAPRAIITGDAAYVADLNIANGVPSGYWVDLPDAMAALRRIVADSEGIVLPMHDRTVRERYSDGIR